MSDTSAFIPPNGIVNEDVWGMISRNFILSGYVCPHCSHTLYKTVFPEENDPILYLGKEREEYISPARIFASPCGRFFAAPKGQTLKGGVFAEAVIVHSIENKAETDLFHLWMDHFDHISDLNARRHE